MVEDQEAYPATIRVDRGGDYSAGKAVRRIEKDYIKIGERDGQATEFFLHYYLLGQT